MNKGISLICACKNRLNALKISLASWLENKNIQEIIIVDWSSDLPIQDNITLDSRIKVIRVEGQTYFNQPQPLNLALKLCTYDTVIKVDCDYIFNTYEGFNFFEKYNIDDYCFICGKTDELDSPADPCFKYLRGLLYIKKKFLEEVGGWNENFREYYGGEDDEIESRLVYYGLKKKKIKLDYTLIHIPHLSKERIINFEGYNLLESKEKLRTILINNHLAHNPLSNIPLTEIEWGWETNTKALSELSAGYNILNNNIQNYYIPSLTKWDISQTSSQLFTAQIVVNKLEGFPTIYCASLEESINRREKLNIQFAEYGLKPKYLLSKRYHECDDIIVGASLFSVDNKTKGCAVSHLKMIKEWYNTTNEEYGFFCEDDLSLETVKYWNFTFQEFINQLPPDWEAVQMCIIRDAFDEIKLRKRQLDDWAVTAYIIKREYAKKIIDYYITQSKNTTESISSQQESIVYKLEVNGWPQVQPLVEHIILLNTGVVYCFPLFIENINNPTTSNESQAPNHITSANFIKNWWENQYTVSSNNVIPKEISLNIGQSFEHNLPFNYKSLKKKYNLNINGIIHVGAHYGEEVLDYIESGVNNIILFEPLKDNFNVLSDRMQHLNANIILNNIALGSVSQTSIMYVSDNEALSSSILVPNVHLTHHPNINFPDIEEVSVDILDNFNYKNYNYLHIDVQGYELEVLKGATETLKHIDYVLCEVNRDELYEGNAYIEEIDEFLKQYDMERVETYWMGDIWGDALYVKNKN